LDANDVRKRILEHYGIRVDPEMSAYALRQLQQAGQALRQASFPIMGGDARTGVAVRRMIDANTLAGRPIAS